MPTPLKIPKGEGRFSKDYNKDDLFYEAKPIIGVEQKGFNIKQANIERLLPDVGANRRELEIETIAGGKPVRIKGDVANSTSVTPGNSGSAGDVVILWSDFKVYGGDGAVAGVVDMYYGVALTDYTKDTPVTVQTVGTVYDIYSSLSGGTQYMSDGTAISSAVAAVTATNEVYNDGSSDYWQAQNFSAGASDEVISSVKCELSAVGSPTGNLVIALYAADGSGNPTGSALWSTTLDAGTLSGTASQHDFAVMLAITGGNDYALTFHDDDSGTMNSTNYVNIEPGASGGGHRVSTNGGSSWSAGSTTLFHIIRKPNGAFSTTEGTYSKKVGIAVATDKLEITK